MGLLLRAAQSAVNAVWSLRSSSLHPRDPALAEMFGASSATFSGVSVTPESALQCPPVYACVRLVSNTVSTIPLDLFERTGPDANERATGHPLHELLHDAPNGWQTSAEFRALMETHVLTHGNGYARVLWRGNGMPEALEPLHPREVMPFRAPRGGVAYRWTPSDGPTQTLMSHEMLHLRRPPFRRDMIRGESPVEQHREVIGAAMGTLHYLSRFFSNNAVPKGGIEVPSAISDKAAEALRETWERRHKGLENAHRLAILDGGMKYIDLGMSNQDAQVVENYRQFVAQIASVYGVPLHMIGETDRSTSWGTGIEQQSIGFVVYCVRPSLVMWEQALKKTLLTAEGRRRFYFEHNVDGLVRGDFKTRMEGMVMMVQWGISTPNEVRRLLNMPPVPGGDERLHPLNMAPASKILDILLKPDGVSKRLLDELRSPSA
ncbi:phage portal protein [Azospirillum doebereinerae]|uniref:phage portal protein n=1 Tax=Azospirillum doebereinerae TaxID=92933 RepID=UPI001EE5E8EA|nr:phage portal protein [Azospirillum doebereinerae]MCG5239535.1 phage portal protein [Azospirillum doebereinerae]